MSICMSACFNSQTPKIRSIFIRNLALVVALKGKHTVWNKLQIKRIKQGAFAPFPSSCPSLRIYRLPMDGFQWNLALPRKSVEKIQISLKSDENIGHVTSRPARVSCRRQRHALLNNKQKQLPRFHGNAVNITLLAAIYVCQQYKGNTLFRFHSNDGYVKEP